MASGAHSVAHFAASTQLVQAIQRNNIDIGIPTSDKPLDTGAPNKEINIDKHKLITAIAITILVYINIFESIYTLLLF